MMSPFIAVTGGIGCGKSVVCRILSEKGFQVYDCDSRAKTLVDTSPEIIENIASGICPEAVRNNNGSLVLDRRRLAQDVFSDPEKLTRLNALVHGAVIEDIKLWYETNADGTSPLFVETAILYQSGLDKVVDIVWEVAAPVELRLQRACLRDGATSQAIAARIRAQQITVRRPHPRVFKLTNDDITPLLPQINHLLADLK